MQPKIRAAIIGCGSSTEGKGGVHSVSYAHGWAYRHSGRVDLVGVVSPPTDENFHHGRDPNIYYHRAVADILHAIDTVSPTRIDAHEAVRSLELMLAIHESARIGAIIDLPLMQQLCPSDMAWRSPVKS